MKSNLLKTYNLIAACLGDDMMIVLKYLDLLQSNHPNYPYTINFDEVLYILDIENFYRQMLLDHPYVQDYMIRFDLVIQGIKFS